MLKPEISQLIEENKSTYSLVIAIAKRSRDLAERSAQDGVELYDKPVNVAIDEFGSHKLHVVEGYADPEA